MFQVITVCTGNICRSPLAALLLGERLGDLGADVSSAGVRGLTSAPMTPEAQRLAAQLGVPDERIARHRSRFLQERMLTAPDLILTMTRDHRRDVAELAPTRLRSTFTVREFARLSAEVTGDEIAAAAEAGTDAAARVRATGALIASRRGLVLPPAVADDDDVIDPFGRPWEVYVQSAAQLTPALDEIERVLRAALTA